jgi:hypothetical protein
LKQGVVQSWHGTGLTSFNGEIQCDHRYEKDCNDWVTLKTNDNLGINSYYKKKKKKLQDINMTRRTE